MDKLKIFVLLCFIVVSIFLVFLLFLVLKKLRKSNIIESLTTEAVMLQVDFADLSENILSDFRNQLGDILVNLGEPIDNDRVSDEIETKINSIRRYVKGINKNPKYTKQTTIPTTSQLGKFNVLLDDFNDWKNKEYLKGNIAGIRGALLLELESRESKEHS